MLQFLNGMLENYLQANKVACDRVKCRPVLLYGSV